MALPGGDSNVSVRYFQQQFLYLWHPEQPDSATADSAGVSATRPGFAIREPDRSTIRLRCLTAACTTPQFSLVGSEQQSDCPGLRPALERSAVRKPDGRATGLPESGAGQSSSNGAGPPSSSRWRQWIEYAEPIVRAVGSGAAIWQSLYGSTDSQHSAAGLPAAGSE